MSGKINIAIAGGGITGLCLARGLSKCANLNVTVYEATAEYLDVGAGLAFHGNAIRALDIIDPELKAEYFRRATKEDEREIEMSTEIRLGDIEGEDQKGRLLALLGTAKGRKTLSRADFLYGLNSLVPEGTLQFGKRLAKIEENDDETISLWFKDGSTARADVLIGCDGINAVTRSYLLGADHPAVGPAVHKNWVWAWRFVPAEEARLVNPDLLKIVPAFCGRATNGRGSHVVSMPVHQGKTVSVTVAQRVEKPTTEAIASPSTRNNTGVEVDQNAKVDELDFDAYGTWCKYAQDVVELARREPGRGWDLTDQDAAPFYTKRRICMAGDAAHATLPFIGQGAAQAIEDAAVLSAVFREVKDISEVEAALKAFEAARKERSLKVSGMARKFANIYFYEDEETGGDPDKMEAFLKGAVKYTNEVDLYAQNEAALKAFQSFTGRTITS